MSSEKEEILKYLKLTGYPLELKVAKTLNSLGWGSKKYYYRDIDEDKIREIDFVSVKSYKMNLGEERGFSRFSFNLVIECKFSPDKPWVFFSPVTTDLPSCANVASADYRFPPCDPQVLGTLQKRIISKKIAHFSADIRTADGWTLAFLDKESNKKKESYVDKIFTSIMGVLKCTDSLISHSSQDFIDWDIYQPLVVVDGSLWGAYLNDENEICVDEVEEVRFRWHYANQHRWVDIVKFSRLESYLKRLISSTDEIATDIQDIVKRYTEYKGITDKAITK